MLNTVTHGALNACLSCIRHIDESRMLTIRRLSRSSVHQRLRAASLKQHGSSIKCCWRIQVDTGCALQQYTKLFISSKSSTKSHRNIYFIQTEVSPECNMVGCLFWKVSLHAQRCTAIDQITKNELSQLQ